MSSKQSGGASKLVPPLKWAGGKRWFVANHMGLVPTDFRKYIEPFMGSGAMYFAIQPQSAILSDLNEDLINLYKCLRDRPDLVGRYMVEHSKHHCKEYYYRVRDARTKSNAKLAARLLYLNRTCWNGLYRVNKKGEFNVPIGTKNTVLMPTDDFSGISNLLSKCEILAADFEYVIGRARKDDFVFVDPPYTVAHNKNGFIKYNEKLFSWEDQIRLATAVKQATSRGAKVLVTNSNHTSIHELYREYERLPLRRASVIAGAAEARGSFDEVVIRCFRR